MYFNLKVHWFYVYGDIAQLARAPALQAGGQGFDSLYLHQRYFKKYLKQHIEKYIDEYVTQYKQEVQGNEIKFLWIIHMYMNKNFIEIDTAIRSLDEVTQVTRK